MNQLKFFITKRVDDDALFLFRWFIHLRTVITLATAVVTVLLAKLELLRFDPRPILFLTTPAFLLVNGIWFWIGHKGHITRHFLYLQFFVDLALITAQIYLAPGIQKQFILLYAFPVAAAALVSFRALLLVGVAALLLSLGFMEVQRPGIVPPAGSYLLGADEITRMLYLALFIGLLGFENYYFTSRIEKKNEEIVKIKDEFLFRTVHDLRTPATAIQFLIEKYMHADDANLPPEIKKDIEMVQDVNTRALALLKELSEVIREERKDFAPVLEELNIVALVRSAIRELEPLRVKKSVVIRYSPTASLPAILGEPRSMQEIFSNIIENGIKYNREGGWLEITHEVEQAYLKTRIRDSGRGISQGNLKKLFLPYFRAGGDQETQGTGLGLYLVKKMIGRLKGKIEVASTLGSGTTVTVYFPLAHAKKSDFNTRLEV